MKAHFFLKSPPPSHVDGKLLEHEPVEYVQVSGVHNGKDLVVRRATEADKQKWAAEYALFKSPGKAGPKAEAPKTEDSARESEHPHEPAPVAPAPKKRKGIF